MKIQTILLAIQVAVLIGWTVAIEIRLRKYYGNHKRSDDDDSD